MLRDLGSRSWRYCRRRSSTSGERGGKGDVGDIFSASILRMGNNQK